MKTASGCWRWRWDWLLHSWSCGNCEARKCHPHRSVPPSIAAGKEETSIGKGHHCRGEGFHKEHVLLLKPAHLHFCPRGSPRGVRLSFGRVWLQYARQHASTNTHSMSTSSMIFDIGIGIQRIWRAFMASSSDWSHSSIVIRILSLIIDLWWGCKQKICAWSSRPDSALRPFSEMHYD